MSVINQPYWFAPEVKDSVPPSLLASPVEYMEAHGRRIKPGKVIVGNGLVKDDPTATMDLPPWSFAPGAPAVVVKRVAPQKRQVGKGVDPYHELRVMRAANRLGLPAARALGQITREAGIFIFMERALGTRLLSAGLDALSQRFPPAVLSILNDGIKSAIAALSADYDRIGIRRQWHIKDMVVDFDPESMAVRSVTPVDWGSARVDWARVRQAVKDHGTPTAANRSV